MVFQSAHEARNTVNGSVPLLKAELSACDVYPTSKTVPLAHTFKGLSLQAPNLLLFPCPSSRPIASVISELRKRARTARNISLVMCFRRFGATGTRFLKKIAAIVDKFVGVQLFKCNLCCIDGTWREARVIANLNADFFADEQACKNYVDACLSRPSHSSAPPLSSTC